MLLFDRGQRIESGLEGSGCEPGLQALDEYVAGLAGKHITKREKLSRLESVEWTRANLDLIEKVALGQTEEWLNAKEPFAFYGACGELHSARVAGRDFITHLPIMIDATCSGYQHLAALTRDAVAAAFVNLDEGHWSALPQSMYTEVARLVNERVLEWRAALVDVDGLQLVKIDRGLIKTPTMSYVYSARPYGMGEQLDEEFEDRDYPGHRKRSNRWRFDVPSKRALLLAKLIEDAIGELFPRSVEVMEFLRECNRNVTKTVKKGDKVTKPGKILSWRSPTGFPVSNRYYESKTTRVGVTLPGISTKMTIAYGYEPNIDTRRASNAIVPNLIHSLDAALLMRIVNACKAEPH
jgi:DNA-directed RNA polymerase